jgi:septal ring factor EnvC (AmiA/AmiB activator)
VNSTVAMSARPSAGRDGRIWPSRRHPWRARGWRWPCEAAVNRRHDEDRQRDALEAQLQAFGSDRSKLAAELDHVRARSDDLESANREVSRRLERAADTIRTVLAAQER